MVKLREIPRTATFAWSPGTASPLIATGTSVGAVDEAFSNDTQLELWDLDLSNANIETELHPTASIQTDSRFHDIAWGLGHEDSKRGIIAGALENGSLDLWDAEKLVTGNGNSFISRTSKHSGAIKALQFNPFHSNLLATAGAKGELYISDINNIGSPYRLGNPAPRPDDIDCLDWNKKIPHILAVASSGGFITVWNVKTKQESLTFNNEGRKAVSAVAWDPEKPTTLVTATAHDTDPMIHVWDLRNTKAPERIMHGHAGGVLSLSWCMQDSDLLLSCGKDNRSICWNPQTGIPYGEFSVVTNWTFETRWNPHNPNLLATASFDGKIAVRSIQDTGSESDKSGEHPAEGLEGEDFFNKARSRPQTAAFTLPKAPKWLSKPCGASFGFGGKLVTFHASTSSEATSKSAVRILIPDIDNSIIDSSESFEKALSNNDLNGICENKVAEADTKAQMVDWQVIQTMLSEDRVKDLKKHLGFSKEFRDDPDTSVKLDIEGKGKSNTSDLQKDGTVPERSNRLSSFFDDGAEADVFLSELPPGKDSKIYRPFQLYSQSEPEIDRMITHALLTKQFEKAMELCLKEDRMSDAFVIAICGGQECIEKAKQAYFARDASGPNYQRLLASIAGKNLWDIVHHVDIESWKDVMAALCSYANPGEFPDLCGALGDRLVSASEAAEGNDKHRKDASFCYIAGSKLEKLVPLWLEELEASERSGLQEPGNDFAFSIHARALQSFIEKVTVFREVIKFKDEDLHAESGWKLASLYAKYIEYADFVAVHGQLDVAERYLSLLPERYPAADGARGRVKHAMRKESVAQEPIKQPANAPRPAQQKASATISPNIQALPMHPTAAPTVNRYTPPTSNQPQNPYPQMRNEPYGALGYQKPQQQPGIMRPPTYGAPNPPQHQGPPPPQYAVGLPSIPPPSKDKNMGNWNDMPDNFFKPPTSRRGTPAAGANPPLPPSPYQSVLPPQPATGQTYNSHLRSTSPLPPPPRGLAPPPRLSSPLTGGSQPYQYPARPPSSAANSYAPQQPASQPGPSQQQPPTARGPSLYNVPPSAPPPSNRYTPTPTPQVMAPSSQPPPSITNGNTRAPPPSNPYAPQQNHLTQQGQGSHQQTMNRDALVQSRNGLLSGPPQGPPTEAQHAPVQNERASAASAAASKYPSGDRSHISPNARPIFEVLNNEMHHVKSKAPSSFRVQVNDTEKRLNILFDHLNNDDLLQEDTLQEMVSLVEELRARNYDQALAIHLELMTNKTDQCGNWMVGVKRLIGMVRATSST